jgi:hypothetical protein
MPVFIAKHNEYKLKDPHEDNALDPDAQINMLGTIKLPRNMKLVNLPKSNYEADSKKMNSEPSRNALGKNNAMSAQHPVNLGDALTEIKEVTDE